MDSEFTQCFAGGTNHCWRHSETLSWSSGDGAANEETVERCNHCPAMRSRTKSTKTKTTTTESEWTYDTTGESK